MGWKKASHKSNENRPPRQLNDKVNGEREGIFNRWDHGYGKRAPNRYRFRKAIRSVFGQGNLRVYPKFEAFQVPG